MFGVGLKINSFILKCQPQHRKRESLEVIFEPMAGFHLTETPITKDQILKRLEDGRYVLKVKLPDTSQIRWWLLGFGSQVEIIRPKHLRNEFREISKNLVNIYKKK